MARIEFSGCTPMKELHGFSRTFFDGKENPYTTDKLTDDEFNFISGINYATNYILALTIDTLDENAALDDSVAILHNMKTEIAKIALTVAQGECDMDISQFITEFIDSHDE